MYEWWNMKDWKYDNRSSTASGIHKSERLHLDRNEKQKRLLNHERWAWRQHILYRFKNPWITDTTFRQEGKHEITYKLRRWSNKNDSKESSITYIYNPSPQECKLKNNRALLLELTRLSHLWRTPPSLKIKTGLFIISSIHNCQECDLAISFNALHLHLLLSDYACIPLSDANSD